MQLTLEGIFFFFFINPQLIYVYFFILRNFCHRPGENRMFLKIMDKNKFGKFSNFFSVFTCMMS